MIRYRRSLNYKLYQPYVPGRCFGLPKRYMRNLEYDSRGSMVARLKLKGIDGRAQPGVESAA